MLVVMEHSEEAASEISRKRISEPEEDEYVSWGGLAEPVSGDPGVTIGGLLAYLGDDVPLIQRY